MGKRIVRTPQRFWANVKILSKNECWPYLGHLTDDGYGRYGASDKYRDGYEILAHRISFLLSGGKLTKTKNKVLHTCDYPRCCNPRHLYAGTHPQNMVDKKLRGRTVRFFGTENPNVRLSERRVIKIRKSAKSNADLARKYNVSPGTIWHIRAGLTWKHLLEVPNG